MESQAARLTAQPTRPGPSDEEHRRALLAERALAERPSISIRLRIELSMLLCFLFVAGVVLASMALISRVGTFQEFVEKTSTYALEIENARRFEKNYLLYGTNLDDALTRVQTAHLILRGSRDSMTTLVGAPAFDRMEGDLDRYAALLERLGALGQRRGDARTDERAAIERELRTYGAQILADATALVDRERLHLHTAIRASWWVSVGSLLFILAVMAVIAYALTRQIADPLHRFVSYCQRISCGDYSPIQPARRYRDEFSDLAIAVNRMLPRLKDREAQLARTSRMAAVGTLTAGIAHELNNPLNNVSLNAEALMESFESYSDQQKRKMLEDIVHQVERASGTVRNLLDFTRVERPVFVPVSMIEIVRAACRLVGNEAELNGVEFLLDMPEDLPRIEGNPRDLQQVLLNLLLNAIQAMPNGGTLTVRGRFVDQSVEVEVADTGVGIPQEHLGSIFDPFFTTKELGAGTGLGLFVSYGTIEKHQGRIEVQSTEGRGSTFTVILPVVHRRAGHRPLE